MPLFIKRWYFYSSLVGEFCGGQAIGATLKERAFGFTLFEFVCVSWFGESLVVEFSLESCLFSVTVLIIVFISWISILISFISWVITSGFIPVWLFLYVWYPCWFVLVCVVYSYQHNEDDATQLRNTIYLSQYTIYLSLYLKGLCVRGSWRPNRTATYWPPLLWPSAFLSRSPGLLNRRPGSPAVCCVLFSLQHHFSNTSDPQTNWLPVLIELYNSSTPTPLEWHVLIVIERK